MRIRIIIDFLLIFLICWVHYCHSCEIEIEIEGELNVYKDESYVYGTQVDMQEYLWIVQGGEITDGQGTSEVAVVWKEEGSQLLRVSAMNASGCYSFYEYGEVIEVNRKFQFEGSGTEYDPYQIYTETDLDNIRLFEGAAGRNKWFRIMNDIRLTEAWNPIGSEESPFEGNIVGDKVVEILGLYIDRDDIPNVGLIGVLEWNGSLQDLRVSAADNSSIGSGENVGILVGKNYGSISHCFIRNAREGATTNMTGRYSGGLVGFNIECATITMSGVELNLEWLGGVAIGGLVGRNDGDIFSSFSKVNIESKNYVNNYDEEYWGESGLYRYTGGFVGINLGQITRSFSKGKLYRGNYGIAGGLVGHHEKGLIHSCYSACDIDYFEVPSGFVGSTNSALDALILGCYSRGHLFTLGWRTGDGFLGYVDYYDYVVPNISDNFSDKSKSKNSIYFGSSLNVHLATTSMMLQEKTYKSSFGNNDVWDFYSTWSIDEGKGYPVLRPFDSDYLQEFYDFQYEENSGDFLSGSGTEPDPFRIYTEKDLDDIRFFEGGGVNKWFQIMNDIRLTKAWNPIGSEDSPFEGNIVGDRMVEILGLSIYGNDILNIGFIGVLGLNGSLTDLRISLADNSSIGSGENVGALVGKNYGNILNCFVGSENKSSVQQIVGVYAGGLVGVNAECGFINMSGVKLNLRWIGGIAMGGLVGKNEGLILSGFSKVEILHIDRAEGLSEPNLLLGGFVGTNSGVIGGGFSMGKLNKDPENWRGYIGGFVGSHEEGNIFSCYSSCNIDSKAESGGFIGIAGDWFFWHPYDFLIMIGCYSRGHVSMVTENGFQGYVDYWIEYPNIKSNFSDKTKSKSFWEDIDKINNVSLVETSEMLRKETYKLDSDFKRTVQTLMEEGYPRCVKNMERYFNEYQCNNHMIWNFSTGWSIDEGKNYPILHPLFRRNHNRDYLREFYDFQYEEDSPNPFAAAAQPQSVGERTIPSQSPSVNLYPNPTTGKVYIDIPEGVIPSVEVYSMAGKLLFKTDASELDLSTYPNDIYMIRVNGKPYKVVLNK